MGAPPLPQAIAPLVGVRAPGALARYDYFGLGEGPRTGPVAFLPPFGVLEGMGAFFGSLAELMPEEQTTLAGILRLWAGLFVACGFALTAFGFLPSP